MRWQPRFEEYLRPLCLGDDLPVNTDPDAPGAVEAVYAMLQVARVDEDLLALLVARVYPVFYLTNLP